MKLYTYFRSSAAYRVRIALNLKGIDAEQIPVHLVRHGGEQRLPDYLALNPAGLVPTLVDDDLVLPQSLAIIEYLDELWPDPPLLPGAPRERARVVIDQCVDPLYRDLLKDYVREASRRGGHTPHVLEEAFAWHARLRETGSMLPADVLTREWSEA